jgi:glycosyltransferase involved in cell wall biosynthesis
MDGGSAESARHGLSIRHVRVFLTAGAGRVSIGLFMSLPQSSAAVWIVVPAYNEGRLIAAVIHDLRAQYGNVVVVDDGSRDHTGALASRAGATVLRHMLNRGQGAAITTGIRYALASGAQFVVTFDADGQHASADIAALLAPLADGRADVAMGSRFLEGAAQSTMPAGRAWLLRAAVLFTRVTTGLHVTDAHNGLRALSRRAAETIQWRADRMAHASEIPAEIRRHHLRFVEVPVRITYSDYSLGKGQRGLDAIRVLIDYLFGFVAR